MPVAVKPAVDEAARLPEIITVLVKLLEALLINPPWRVVRPVASRVLDTVVAPDTDKVPPILEEE